MVFKKNYKKKKKTCAFQYFSNEIAGFSWFILFFFFFVQILYFFHNKL